MTGQATRASFHDAREPDRTTDFAGAIYGSLLASSTILGTAASASGTVRSPELLVTLLATSVIYWLLHVYVDVVGRERPRNTPWLAATRSCAGHELPILLAVAPPAVAVVATMVVGGAVSSAGWLALWAAFGGQLLWTWLAVRQERAGPAISVLSLAVSTLLGLALVGLKFVIAAH